MSSYAKAAKLYALPDPDSKYKKSKNRKNRIKTKIFQEQNLDNQASTDKNTLLDFYFELQRREHEAATYIKQAWKRTRILLPWRKAVYQMLAIRTIQRMMRGYLARKMVARWYLARVKTITELEARVRRHLCNKYLRPRLAYEKATATTIQRYVRGYYGRKRYYRILSTLAVTRIQALWRGTCARSKADRQWLHKQVIVIQNAMRRKLAMNKFQYATNRLFDAATKIQRQFRMYLAIKRVSEKLHAREFQYRNDVLKLLSAEEDYCVEKLQYIMSRCVKHQIREKAINHQKILIQQENTITHKENMLIELYNQKETLSPRAIEQGFMEELSTQIEKSRNEVAEMKKTYLFDLIPLQQELDNNLETQVEELEEIAALKKRLAKWRIEEYEERRHLYYQRDLTERQKARQQAIAEERRKWQVVYYTSDGKPDKKRRPGKPWDPSVYAKPDKMTYCSGSNVDLLAFHRIQDEVQGKSIVPTAQDSAKAALDKVSLQTYLDQVAVYEQLLQPVQNILSEHVGIMATNDNNDNEHTIGDKKKKKKSQKNDLSLGYGEVGKEFANAMIAIGMDPQPTRTILKKLPKNKLNWKERMGIADVLLSAASSSASAPSSSSGTKKLLNSSSKKKVSFEESNTNSNKKKVLLLENDAMTNNTLTLQGNDINNSSSSSSRRRKMNDALALEPGSTSSNNTMMNNNNNDKAPMLSTSQSLPSTSTTTATFHPRSWKKPYKSLFPSEESFVDSFPAVQDYHEDQIKKFELAKAMREKEEAKKLAQRALGLEWEALYGPRTTSRSLSSSVDDMMPPLTAATTFSSAATAKMKNNKSKISQKFLSNTWKDEDDTVDPPEELDDLMLEGILEKELQKKAKQEEEKERLLTKRKERTERRRRLGVIPWNMLDEIEGQEKRFENEKAYVEFYKKF